MKYTCRIECHELHCTITPDRDLEGAVLCISGMAPLELVSGGVLRMWLGGYAEINLPNLAQDQTHLVRIRYQDGFRPANRAWMPLGPYLRVGSEVIELPPGPAGRVRPNVDAKTPIDGLPVVPEPLAWHPTKGVLTCDGFAITSPALVSVADLAERQGMPFAGALPVTIVEREMAIDAYAIDIAENGVTIEAGSYGGRFYAGITLLMLFQHGPIPCGRIEDSPRFDWRGQHLDTARHFYEPTTILALLDVMALLKLNRFHWHFADDEAFRLEVECIPELWQKTAFRGEGQVFPALFSGSPLAGGTYSKATVRDIIKHAKNMNIEILPEIEAQAHALAVTTLFPETRDPDDTGAERSVQGYPKNVLNPAMPKTWEILEALIAEVGELFPFRHIHLGCDELPDDAWMGSPRAKELMAVNGLETTHDLQGWMCARLGAISMDQGLRPVAWEEAARGSQGGIGHDAILFGWTAQGPALKAAEAGYDVVLTPAQHVYLDMAHSSDPDDWGASWAAFVDLADTINWDPVPDPTLEDRIIGVQGAFWSEFTTEDWQIWAMLSPRLLGVSALSWQTVPPERERITGRAETFDIGQDGRIRIGKKSHVKY